MNIDRMRKLLQALREYPKDRPFLMTCWSHCAFGAYCHREDLQEDFVMRGDVPHFIDGLRVRGPVLSTFDVASAHFGITADQAQLLFGGSGCGAAYTSASAASYVERVIEIAEAIEEVTAPNYQGDPKHGDSRLYETSSSVSEPRVRHWAGAATTDRGGQASMAVHPGAPAAG